MQSIPERRVIPPLTEHLFRTCSRKTIPLSGTFELTPLCNFACRMCYVRKSAAQVAAHPRPMVTLDQWLTLARQVRDAGTLFLLLTGGEPLAHPDFRPLYEALAAMGFLISINTNGSLLDEHAVELFTVQPPRCLNITLYGASDEAYRRLCGVDGVHNRICRSIEALRRADIPVKLNCSLTPDNAGDLGAISDYAKTMGLPLDVATYMFPPVRRDCSKIGQNRRFTPEEAAYYRMEVQRLQLPEDAFARYCNQLLAGCIEPPVLEPGCVDPMDGRVRCRAGSAAYWVTWDGWLTPCGMLPEPRVELQGRTFADAWAELTVQSGALRLSGICSSCQNQALCHACAAMAYAETGSFSGIPRYLCSVSREMQRLARHFLETGGFQ